MLLVFLAKGKNIAFLAIHQKIKITIFSEKQGKSIARRSEVGNYQHSNSDFGASCRTNCGQYLKNFGYRLRQKSGKELKLEERSGG